MKNKYTVADGCSVSTATDRHGPGAVIELDDVAAAQLLAVGVVLPVEAKPGKKPEKEA